MKQLISAASPAKYSPPCTGVVVICPKTYLLDISSTEASTPEGYNIDDEEFVW